MNVLFINHYLPFPLDNGGAIAHSSMIEALAAETDVHLLILTATSQSKENVKKAETHFNQFCKSFTFTCDPAVRPSYSKAIIAWHYLVGRPHRGGWSAVQIESLRRKIESENIDVMWVGSPYAGKYFTATNGTSCKRVLMTHNVESDIVRQEFCKGSLINRVRGHLMWRDVKKLEAHGLAMADVVTAITEHDAAYYRKMKSSENVFVHPFAIRLNGAGADLAISSPSVEPDLCFIGSMDWPPNDDAAYFLAKEVLPLVRRQQPMVTTYIVGKNPSARVAGLASERVVVTGRVSSVQGYLHSAKIIVSPMRKGSGIKIKLIQAMAAGKAIVTTTMGAQGTGMRHSDHALFGDDAIEIADAIVLLLQDNKKRECLGGAAKQLAASHFSMQNCRARVRKIFDHLKDNA